MVDYYSRDIEIAHLATTSSQQVISRLKSMFVRRGIPLELVTDNSSLYATPAKVIAKVPEPRSYYVQTGQGTEQETYPGSARVVSLKA